MNKVYFAFLLTAFFSLAHAQDEAVPAEEVKGIDRIKSLMSDDPAQQPKGSFTPKRTKGILDNLISPYDYQPLGRRDPFAQPEILRPPEALPPHGPGLPLQAYKTNELKVRAILWSVKKPKALVQSPDSKVHLINLGDRVGQENGYVAVIREGEIVIVETREQEGQLLSSTTVLGIER